MSTQFWFNMPVMQWRAQGEGGSTVNPVSESPVKILPTPRQRGYVSSYKLLPTLTSLARRSAVISLSSMRTSWTNSSSAEMSRNQEDTNSSTILSYNLDQKKVGSGFKRSYKKTKKIQNESQKLWLLGR